MADIDYEVRVTVYCKGEQVDGTFFGDEDYGWAMKRLQKWAIDSYMSKDF